MITSNTIYRIKNDFFILPSLLYFCTPLVKMKRERSRSTCGPCGDHVLVKNKKPRYTPGHEMCALVYRDEGPVHVGTPLAYPFEIGGKLFRPLYFVVDIISENGKMLFMCQRKESDMRFPAIIRLFHATIQDLRVGHRCKVQVRIKIKN